jgi:hypothetical protein
MKQMACFFADCLAMQITVARLRHGRYSPEARAGASSGAESAILMWGPRSHVKLILAATAGFSDAVEKLRRQQTPLPTKADVIRAAVIEALRRGQSKSKR